VARHLQAFAYPALLISRIGQDKEANMLINGMADCGLSTLGIQIDQRYPTGQVDIRFEGKKHHFDILPAQAYDYIDPSQLADSMANTQPAISYFGSLAQRADQSKLALEQFLNNSTGLRFFDINLRAPWYNEDVIRQSLQQADIVKMNDEELKLVADLLQFDINKPESSAFALMQQFKLKQLLVTCGALGAWVLDEQGIKHQVELDTIPAERIVDTVGAGDAFAAVYMVGLLQNWPIKSSLGRAQEFAGAICQIRGAVPETQVFYRPYIEAWSVN
jgi:fructokinase